MPTLPPQNKLNLYCTCGAAWKGISAGEWVEIVKAEWAKLHSGPGHQHCGPKTAARARDRAERERIVG